MAVVFEEREDPCLRCAAPVAVKVITESRPRVTAGRYEPVHEDDGSPADRRCRRVPGDGQGR
ncbi:hypothetical protein LWP59_25865 [Amycolatopsis acidiphila]|uniref:Uncharacterized protein n=1 Tax=Amycolatopsis acidiphila TaxID=715473 RepID=A0A558AKZ0_9PSEU|nr:hypothetical protein [Amycolatopsis acidiphila]TVT24939.1 hypothetical protein FNH06_03690 [Amycolatopsis acidiphila]UIJ57562.1 hypothetical protein LWP59_25865 [Amycolatopsis acidiphila]GHG89504.1 hypothetical protein GCM10017788_64290 [Amycolatopsis acidiphila]